MEKPPFKQWLESHDVSAYEFARQSRIAEPTIYKAARGVPVRCDTVDKILKYALGLRKEDFKILEDKFSDMVDEKVC